MSDIPTAGEDEDDFSQCEACSAKHPIEEMTPTLDGCDLCPKCWAEAKADFKACSHVWKPDFDQWGDPAHFCQRCSFIVTDRDFPGLFGVPAPERVEEDADAE